MKPIISIDNLRFAWPGQAPMLEIQQLQLQAGEHLFIQGPSGSGKSTLLNLIAGILGGFEGEISLAGQPLANLSERQRDRLRADHIGVLFQQFNLLPYLNLTDNVSLPCTLSAPRREAAIRRSGSVQAEAHRLLERLQLPTELFQRRAVAELSIGQQQRVAAARALIGAPELIIADEPTSALDGASRDRFMQLLLEELDQSNTTLLLVSHDPALSEYFSRHLTLEGAGSC